MLSGIGKWWRIELRCDLKFLKIGKSDDCHLLNCFVCDEGTVKYSRLPLVLNVVGNPKELDRMVLIMDNTKNIGARMKGLVRPRPPDMMLREAICIACSGSVSR